MTHPKRPRDPNQLAKSVIDIATGQKPCPLGVIEAMDSAQHCIDQAAECLRLVKLALSKEQAEVLRNLSSSWSRLVGQIDRYNALVREQGRIARE
jgi:hypothetical protein